MLNILVKIVYEKKIFDPKFSKNLFFWLFFVKNSINPVNLQSSIDVGQCEIVQNDCNTIIMKWVKIFLNFSPQKNQKNWCLSKNRIFFEKPVFGQLWSKTRLSNETVELNRRRESCNSAEWQQYKAYEKGEIFFEILIRIELVLKLFLWIEK